MRIADGRRFTSSACAVAASSPSCACPSAVARSMYTLRLLRFRLAKYTLWPSTVRAPDLARQVAADRLDLDHVGAEVGEQHPRERAREDVPDLEHPDPGERPGRRRASRPDQTSAQRVARNASVRLPRLDARRRGRARSGGSGPRGRWRPRRGSSAAAPIDGRLVARREQVADVAGVALLEQPLVVRRVLGVAEHDGSPMRAPRRPRRRAHSATGRPATTRGRGRPASSAAFVMRGTMWSPIARSSAIQRIVPDACSPATRSITGASAARRIGVGAMSVMSSGLCTRKLSFSTSTVPGPGERGVQHLEVVAHETRRSLVGQPEHVLDDPVV